MATLLTIRGAHAGVTYDLGERSRIGRLGENEIQVSDPNVSRIHAEITLGEKGYTIVDRGSKNGIIVNGRQVSEKDLQPNDEITIGNASFVFDASFDILNSRFSGNAAYITETAPVSAGKQFSLSSKEQESTLPVEKLKELSAIFGGTPAPLPVTSCRIASGIKEYFGAEYAAIFVRDIPRSPLYPLCISPENQSIVIARDLFSRVDELKAPVCFTQTLPTPAGFGHDGREMPTVSSDNKTQVNEEGNSGRNGRSGGRGLLNPERNYLCAPMINADSDILGMVVIALADSHKHEKHQLVVLQSMAQFVLQAIQSIRLVELSKSPAVNIPLDPETHGLSTRSLRMQEIYNSARRSAEGRGTILITGEGGTGKETLARYIHQNSPYANGPFVSINCSSLPEDQFEKELFGYEAGAFEGAESTHIGALEKAQGGTLYFADVNELDMALQPKLLRFLQDRAFTRLGGTRAINSDIRVIAATQADLAASVRAGRFREDLWYRLNVVPFHVPPLRERREDVRALVEFFINQHNKAFNKKILAANDAAISLLQKYDWPGNLRELENSVERAVMLADSRVLSISDFVHIEEARKRLNSQADLERKRDTKPLAEVERQHIMIALKKHNFNQARAAEALGLHRNTLRNKIIEYGIEITK